MNQIIIDVKLQEAIMTKFRKVRNQKGFTLVELAIVLVIIGIILAGIIKGQELIANAKIKRAVSAQKEITAAFYTYYDRYQFYPGDDRNAATRWAAAGITTATDSNGFITNAPGVASTAPNFACVASGAEQCDLWNELRQAGIISGATTGAAAFNNPQHPYGGAIAVSYQTINAVTRNWIHLQNIPADVAAIIDQQSDDGVWNTGTIRGSAVYTTGTNVTLSFGL
jgi:prepilin-type N-terminal cleavage/methylation domain-containing protein